MCLMDNRFLGSIRGSLSSTMRCWFCWSKLLTRVGFQISCSIQSEKQMRSWELEMQRGSITFRSGTTLHTICTCFVMLSTSTTPKHWRSKLRQSCNPVLLIVTPSSNVKGVRLQLNLFHQNHQTNHPHERIRAGQPC